jgi:branched-chain amino acid aminotransferase
MVNYNGIISNDFQDLANNRSFLFGDGVFETLKVVNGKILFWEDHYFRFMASLRIIRMRIPMEFTMEFLEQQVLDLMHQKAMSNARVRITVFRNAGGKYMPDTSTVSYLIDAEELATENYQLIKTPYEVELYKDFYVSKQLLSTLKTTNKIIYITASIFANENGFQNCLLINEDKNIVEATQGNIFMVLGNTLITPPLTEGCLNGIMRLQILRILKKQTKFQWEERPISPFELQKADELFITNVVKGIQPITKYRKKEFNHTVAAEILTMLNQSI